MQQLPSGFLPVSKKEIDALGWEEVDFVCVTGDAYVDHPSFGIAIIARLLESQGYRVAILAQPDFHSYKDFTRFGRPKYAFLITGGNIDSMVAHYTAAKRRRSDDAYTPGNVAGKRPDRAGTVYAQLAKAAYPDCPVVLGGLEASLRRFAHYDYWDDAVHPSVLVSSGADLLIYGMGENQITQIAASFASGKTTAEMQEIRGISYITALNDLPAGHVSCASFEKVAADKAAYAKAAQLQLEEQDCVYGKHIVQKHGDSLVVQTPPSPLLTQQQLDAVFALPFMRNYHPMYQAMGGVKAIEEVQFSIMHNRGCFGGCNFCSITMHQGRQIVSRSHDSVVTEAESFVQDKDFKGYIHDVGGPTANFRAPSCQKQLQHGLCRNKRCLVPNPCPSLEVDHTDYLALLRKLRAITGVKKVFIRSGLRYDYLNCDKKTEFLQELAQHHISGQLKVAPEHSCAQVLAKMGKPSIAAFEVFFQNFYTATKKAGKEQYLVPYLMSSHPGSTLADAVSLALFLKRHDLRPQQVQDFYPTPGTISTTMFYTGLDPATMKPVYIPRTTQEKFHQRILLQYFKPENRRAVIEALLAANRRDLIGPGKDCLVAHLPGSVPVQRTAPTTMPGRSNARPSEKLNSKRSKGRYR